MDGELRRKELVNWLKDRTQPVPGAELARHFGVSRQVIVQDIALLRATDKNILSTNKGYVLFIPESTASKVQRSFPVYHKEDQIKDELYTIVDCGGKVLDVVVAHDIYGQITADLILKTRLDVDDFVERIKNSTSQPLSILTGGEHWHTVEADSEHILDTIECRLRKKGYLR